jgi:hypothetical protein
MLKIKRTSNQHSFLSGGAELFHVPSAQERGTRNSSQVPSFVSTYIQKADDLPGLYGLTVSHPAAKMLSTSLWRENPRLFKIPPYLSFLCVVIGITWLLILPWDQNSRHTYVSENALLPGQVHTYFAGSDQNVFRAFKHEVDALGEKNNTE